jgi:chaperonin GroES
MSVKPLIGKIAVVPVQADQRSQGGIILAKAKDNDTAIHGKVIAIGRNRVEFGVEIPTELNVGDVVVYGTKTQFVQANISGQDCHLIRETDVWCSL